MDSLFSDFDSYSESCSSEDQDDINSLFGGQARSIFSSLEESIEKLDDFLLFERGFTPGDIVSLASDPLGQTGKVLNVDLIVDLENANGMKIRNISAKELEKIRMMSVDDYVVHGAWIGKVEKIADRLTVLFDDGTKGQFTAGGLEDKIIVISPDLMEDPHYPFYPGQRVQVECSSVSKSTNWLCGMRKSQHKQGTVCNVEAGVVYVDWIDCAIGEKRHVMPASLQDSKDLSVLSSFTHANWQLGDWCILSGTHDSNFQQIAVIAKTKTKVDIQWQDGSQSFGLDSHSLYPANIIDVHDFWPGVFVLEKETVDDSRALASSKKWGIVKSVDSKEKTVKVKWCRSDQLDCEEEVVVSAYELAEHPDYAFCLGDAVFRNAMYVEDEIDKNVGVVMGFKDEDVEVKWASGSTAKVAPYEICRLCKCESTTASFIPGTEDVLQSHEEVLVKKNDASSQKEMFHVDCGNAKDSSSYSLSQIAIGVFTSIASMMKVYPFESENDQILEKSLDEDVLEPCDLPLCEQLPLAIDDSEMVANETVEHIQDTNVNNNLSSRSKYPKSIKQFDMVNDCTGHHFFDGPGPSLQMKRGWLKKVQQEWSILEKDLPGSIYVRVYEERMDLLRAAIVGANGTPYHDNLFFFDIQIPQQYPNEPPMVYYNSGGLRINPNLYESGKVCLSLLNTWSGSNSEVWNPGSSTILQVLLSLQALVLNEKPYFNEAGYDSQIGKPEGEKNSLTYNENAFLVSCRSMLYLLHRPPKHFEALVHEHFSKHGRCFLLACKAYMEGAPIGYPFSSEKEKGSSVGFKIMLGKLIPRLVEGFSNENVDCGDPLHQAP